MIAGRNELFESERFFAGQNADVGHTDNRQAVPAFRAKRSPRTIGADGMSRLAGAQIAGKQSVADDRSALRGYTFIVEGEGAESRTVFLAGIGDNIDQIAAVAQSAQLVEGE